MMSERRLFVLCLAAAAAGALLAARDAHSQNRVRCWNMPNGVAFTTICENGFWQSIMPDGTVETGNGMVDPSASNPGSSIPLGQQKSARDYGSVQAPPPNQSNPAPGQWYYYGGQAPQ